MAPRRRDSRPQTAMTTIGGQLVLSERLATFKRVYRWLNLTLVHQATWPLLLLLTSAPSGEPEATPTPWYLARAGAPLVAALLAAVYLWQRPANDSRPPTPSPSEGRGEGRGAAIAQQARFLLIGLPIMVGMVRLVEGPAEPAAKLMVVGLAEVAAYHLIHFGVVVRSYVERAQGLAAATLLFAVSWGMHDALLVAFGPSEGSPALALLGGFVLGLAIALLSRLLHAWPGGAVTAAAAHWLLVYLIFGFAG